MFTCWALGLALCFGMTQKKPISSLMYQCCTRMTMSSQLPGLYPSAWRAWILHLIPTLSATWSPVALEEMVHRQFSPWAVLLFSVSVAGTRGSDRWREPPSSKPCFLFAPAQTSTRPAKRALCTVQGLRGKAYMLVWEKCCECDYVWWALTVLGLFVLRNWPGQRRSLFYSWEYLIRVACAFLQGGVLKD